MKPIDPGSLGIGVGMPENGVTDLVVFIKRKNAE
jgi:hypothetical protein